MAKISVFPILMPPILVPLHGTHSPSQRAQPSFRSLQSHPNFADLLHADLRHRYVPFGHQPHPLRLLDVRSLFRSIAMGTGRAVLAAPRVRPIERRENFRTNRNRRRSPDQRGEVIQRRKSPRARVSAVRIHPANPFENRGNSDSDGRPERVRKGENGGGRGIRTLDTVARIHAFQACAFNHSATPPSQCRR